jgi:hypothetical protein
MMVGFGDANEVTVGITYADDKAIVIESQAGPDGLAISADRLAETIRIRHFMPSFPTSRHRSRARHHRSWNRRIGDAIFVDQGLRPGHGPWSRDQRLSPTAR